MPDDLLKFGLIPEFIGRLPVVATLRHAWTKRRSSRSWWNPKTRCVKQYAKFFEYDGVDLAFTDGALREIAREAMKRSTGARALRTIIEEVMLNIMYEIPSSKDIKRCVVEESTVRDRVDPDLYTAGELRQAS